MAGRLRAPATTSRVEQVSPERRGRVRATRAHGSRRPPRMRWPQASPSPCWPMTTPPKRCSMRMLRPAASGCMSTWRPSAPPLPTGWSVGSSARGSGTSRRRCSAGPTVAAAGQLNILAAGRPEVVDGIVPVLDVLGARVWRLGDRPRIANVVKVEVNYNIIQHPGARRIDRGDRAPGHGPRALPRTAHQHAVRRHRLPWLRGRDRRQRVRSAGVRRWRSDSRICDSPKRSRGTSFRAPHRRRAAWRCSRCPR